MFAVIVDDTLHWLSEPEEFDQMFEAIQGREHLSLHFTGIEEHLLSVWLNGRAGMMRFALTPEDGASITLNPAREESPDETESFVGSTGATETVPQAWTYDRAVIIAAMRHFVHELERPPQVSWTEEFRW